MEVAVASLSIALAVVSLMATVLGSAVPFLWYRVQKLDEKLDTQQRMIVDLIRVDDKLRVDVDGMDEVLDEMLQAAGVGVKSPRGPVKPEEKKS